ncbi:MAG: GAF domain-containing protein [Ignavibacteriales bacterium]|nr:GAF domain-containing protein [Ignavibacteriales bacterium]
MIDDKIIYEDLLKKIDSLISRDILTVSNLCNFIAAINESFSKISWIGYYFLKDEKLYLGPFQGKVACNIIKIGKGVCGKSVEKGVTLIVPNTHEYPGHIACDAGSKSEIVCPIFYKGKIMGVLDIDSYEFDAFNETDKIYLEKLLSLLVEKIDFSNFNIL